MRRFFEKLRHDTSVELRGWISVVFGVADWLISYVAPLTAIKSLECLMLTCAVPSLGP